MLRQTRKFDWLSRSMALFFCLVVALAAAAQDEGNTPPPPPDQAPSLQQPAPESQVRAVRISAVDGGVQVFQGGSVAFQQAKLNMPIVQGMKLVTGQNGRAEVQFEDGSVARVAPNSSITMEKLGSDEDGNTLTVIRADTGLTYYELNGRAGQYSVEFGPSNIVLIPVESTIFRLDLDQPQAELAVMHGSVHMSDDENLSADVHTDQSVHFDPQNPDEYQLLQSVTANTWDQWNSDRDEALAAMDESETSARAGMEEPDNQAWSDLDAYGDWYDIPGYGMGWSPSGVDADWDPYGLGAWGYYSGIGYTWISGYSWGWWPYHCGAWSWFDGFGWMWFPANCGWGSVGFGGWYPYGTILNVPHGYRCPRRPRWHHPGRHPINDPRHGPHHGPVRHNPRLIAVNRGPRFTRQSRIVGVRTAPREFQFEGRVLHPVTTRIRPLRGGPMGEGFISAVRRTNPGLMNSSSISPGVRNPEIQMRGAYPGSMYRPAIGAYRPESHPGSQPIVRPSLNRQNSGFRAPSRTAPVVRSAPMGPARAPSPVFRGPARAPAPVYHAPAPVYHAPAPSFHPAPPPAFHPAPGPSFHAPAAPAGHGRH